MMLSIPWHYSTGLFQQALNKANAILSTHFVDKETQDQRGELTGLRSHSGIGTQSIQLFKSLPVPDPMQKEPSLALLPQPPGLPPSLPFHLILHNLSLWLGLLTAIMAASVCIY